MCDGTFVAETTIFSNFDTDMCHNMLFRIIWMLSSCCCEMRLQHNEIVVCRHLLVSSLCMIRANGLNTHSIVSMVQLTGLNPPTVDCMMTISSELTNFMTNYQIIRWVLHNNMSSWIHGSLFLFFWMRMQHNEIVIIVIFLFQILCILLANGLNTHWIDTHSILTVYFEWQ